MTVPPRDNDQKKGGKNQFKARISRGTGSERSTIRSSSETVSGHNKKRPCFKNMSGERNKKTEATIPGI